MRKYWALVALLILALSSCGNPGGSGIADKEVLLSSAILEGGTPLDDHESSIAYRVCFALRAKRFYYLNSEDFSSHDQKLKYDYQKKLCDEMEHKSAERLELALIKEEAKLSYDYDNNGVKLFNDVLTDQQGPLKEICPAVLKGETAIDVSKSNDHVYEVSFLSDFNGDGVLIKEASEKVENGFEHKVSKVYSYYVLTDATISGNLLGVIYKAEQLEKCQDSDNYSVTNYQFVDE